MELKLIGHSTTDLYEVYSMFYISASLNLCFVVQQKFKMDWTDKLSQKMYILYTFFSLY